MKSLGEERKIPRTMSTQHPDNARIPEWCKDKIIEGDAEVYEAYFAYSSLGCHEVMWDSEGKDVDTRVVRKLLTNYEDYFKENVIGKDVFLTYRIPNPKVEAAERKIVVETLENIPVGCDVASAFYKQEVIPIFEVILPFTTDGKELVWLLNYYKKAVVGVEQIDLDGTVKIKDWAGNFKPCSIELIPLIEDMESLLKIDKIIEPYMDVAQPKYLRVFIARSDPALNYGLVCAVILSKMALSKLKSLEERKEIPIYPIIGVGSMPFRGHLSPGNVQGFLDEYRGIYTTTIQSALKYDYPLEDAKSVVEILNEKLPNEEPVIIEAHEEKILLEVLRKFKSRYQKIVEELAPLINSVASYVPARRSRKLHIGLFGYSRKVGNVILPRAIPFAGALYSLGIPPEFIGFEALNSLTEEEWDVLRKHYINMRHDLDSVAGYFSMRNITKIIDFHKQLARRAGMEEERLKSALTELLLDIKAVEEKLDVKIGPKNLTHEKYENIINNFLISYIEQNDEEAKRYFEEAAKIRKCIG
ncbi:MAG: phosphoenolpyruvate carboxylase [Nitrososphaerota archaeon]|nr:phosphoenolpyruvate carboxylase [Candidatus Bathyarchaeota archaeon]MDW8048529.1 phosphoenolpyruvate carboxylase [Nitrososphaerota archaeon]